MAPYGRQIRAPRAASRSLLWAAQICLAGSIGAAPFSFAAQQQLVPIEQANAWQRHAQFDAGRLPASTKLQNVTLVLQPSAPAALQRFLSDVQNPRSPQYHHWLAPEEFAAQFGASQSSLAQVQSWLKSNGISNAAIARGGLWLRFSANTGTIETLFHTEFHRLATPDREHFANSTPAVIPRELSPIIAGVAGLDDFGPQPQTVRPSAIQPNATALGPADLANVYGMNGLYAQNITGEGMTIAIVGRTPIAQDDVRAYRAEFGLPQNDFEVVAVPRSNGTAATVDEQEADFDLEVANGVAPAAHLVYVWGSTVDAAAEWVIDNRLAAILSESYAGCENTGDVLYQTLAMQAAAEGITWISAAGDSGAAGCDTAGTAAAANGLHATAPASTPGIVAVGGTALSPSIETGWSSSTRVAAGGGGVSALFGKPGYQSDFAPLDSTERMLPDIAFSASPYAAPYSLVFQGQAAMAGGTSLSTPLFAGIVALVNQSLMASGMADAPGLGEINPILYRLSETRPAVFHDITAGSNSVPCAADSPNCVNGVLGYPASSGYDLATGLGSINASALAQNWNTADFGSASLTLTGPASTVIAEQPAELVATVTANGAPLANSPVQFYLMNPAWQPNQILLATVPTDADGIARFTTDALPMGLNSIEAIATGTTSVRAAPLVTATVQITGISSAVSVITPPGPYAIGQSIALQAAVTTSSGASISGPACSIGTVTLYAADGSIQAGPVAVNAIGTANLTTHPLSSGNNSFSVAYSGNCFVAASSSAAFSLPASPANPPDFVLSGPSAMTLAAGSTSTVSFSISPINGFHQTVQFACTTSSPFATCSVPKSLDLVAATQVPVTIAVSSISLQAFAGISGILLVLLFRRRRSAFLLAIVAISMLFIGSCGSTSIARQTTQQSFSVTVTATSGAAVHTAAINVAIAD